MCTIWILVRPPVPESAIGVEEAFSLACHFAFIVPHDVIHVLLVGSTPRVFIFTFANKWGHVRFQAKHVDSYTSMYVEVYMKEYKFYIEWCGDHWLK
jgi:hypothetical protein